MRVCRCALHSMEPVPFIPARTKTNSCEASQWENQRRDTKIPKTVLHHLELLWQVPTVQHTAKLCKNCKYLED
ncbi:hypothetical protein GDO78_013470 [Eleutherodactylus coqui]|uniref:Uncharacterized protein n=1 Tax=Eleutherodactylus coqui TaxID=57060 RepID=A0A8J6F0S8_ELECQ|nr:hypothetical protein GDO78_013470 [Eleutherodactylus coqui]